MKEKLNKILVCPECKSDFELKIFERDEEIKSGQLICKDCKKKYDVKNYIPRFVKNDEYTEPFSIEWYKHQKTQFDSYTNTNETKETFKKKTGFNIKELNDEFILDAGCGAGRFMETVLNCGGEVVGFDLSFSVDIAQKNIGFNKKAHLIQADIFNLPLKNNIFDKIFSIGVLQHTPSPKKAFLNLPTFLKKNGELSIFVFSDEGWYMKLYNRSTDFWRFFTSRLPQNILYDFCKRWAKLMYPIKKLRPLRVILQIILPPSNNHPNEEWRILDTYNWLSPRYQSKHTYKEVKSWFREAGFNKVEKLTPVGFKGKKV